MSKKDLGEEPNKIWQKHIINKANIAYNGNSDQKGTGVPKRAEARQNALKRHLKAIIFLTQNHTTMSNTKSSEKINLTPKRIGLGRAIKPRPKNPKHIVHPGLSLTGREINQRLKNKSILPRPNDPRSYSTDPLIDATRRMSRADAARAMLDNQVKINRMKAQLEQDLKLMKNTGKPDPQPTQPKPDDTATK